MKHFYTNFLEKGHRNKSSGGGQQMEEGTAKKCAMEFTRKKKGNRSLFLSLFWGFDSLFKTLLCT